MYPYLPTRWTISSTDSIDDPDVFPLLPGQSFLTTKSPQWSTARVMSVSGRERRRALWSYPRWNFNVAYEVVRDGPTFLEQQRLFAFFNAHLGGYQAFFFLDKTDHQASAQTFGTGDGVTTSFQLTRTISVGNTKAVEPVRATVGTPTILINGVQTTAFTIGPYGVVTFSTPPANGATLVWSGQFFFLCTFDNDKLDLAQMMEGLWSNSGIPFHSVKI